MSYIFYDDIEGYSGTLTAAGTATLTATHFNTCCGIEITNDGNTDITFQYDGRSYTLGTVKAGESHFEPMTFQAVLLTNLSATVAGTYRVRMGTQTIATKFN